MGCALLHAKQAVREVPFSFVLGDILPARNARSPSIQERCPWWNFYWLCASIFSWQEEKTLNLYYNGLHQQCVFVFYLVKLWQLTSHW